MNPHAWPRRLLLAALALGMVVSLANVGLACPTCKDGLAHDPEAASLAQGIYYSILFMVSMPYLVFASLVAYFYWEVRRARARQAAMPQAAGTLDHVPSASGA